MPRGTVADIAARAHCLAIDAATRVRWVGYVPGYIAVFAPRSPSRVRDRKRAARDEKAEDLFRTESVRALGPETGRRQRVQTTPRFQGPPSDMARGPRGSQDVPRERPWRGQTCRSTFKKLPPRPPKWVRAGLPGSPCRGPEALAASSQRPSPDPSLGSLLARSSSCVQPRWRGPPRPVAR